MRARVGLDDLALVRVPQPDRPVVPRREAVLPVRWQERSEHSSPTHRLRTVEAHGQDGARVAGQRLRQGIVTRVHLFCQVSALTQSLMSIETPIACSSHLEIELLLFWHRPVSPCADGLLFPCAPVLAENRRSDAPGAPPQHQATKGVEGAI